jgi:general secretion pathway protein A
MKDENTIFALIRQPRTNSDFAFLEKINTAFGLPGLNGKSSTLKLEDHLFRFVEKEGFEKKKKIVLIIDEGQELSARQLLRIRELLNMETVEEKLINIVIFAQLEFLDKISGKRFINFRQRVALSYILNPLTEKDTHSLIQFRLQKAGIPKEHDLFTPDAISIIHKESKGLARDICKYASYSLLTAYSQGKKSINGEMVKQEIARIPIR